MAALWSRRPFFTYRGDNVDTIDATTATHGASVPETTRPWWRNAWCWLVLAGPVTVVFAGLTTYWIASSGADTLVDRDYYQKGLALGKGASESSGALAPARQARNHAATGGVAERGTTQGK
jgi:uncharacterized protein